MIRMTLVWMCVLAGVAACARQPSDTTAPPTSATPSNAMAISPMDQEGVAGAPVASKPSVKVFGPNSAPFRGATVEFSVGSGGGSVTGTTQQTDAAGVATVGGWTLGTSAGPNSMTVSVHGIAGTMTFSAQARAGPPAALVFANGAGLRSPQYNREWFSFALQLVDAHGNWSRQSGIVAALAIASGGGTLSGTTTATSDAGGIAHFSSATIQGTVGLRTLSLTAPGLATLSSDVMLLAGAVDTAAIFAGEGQSATVSTPVPTSPAVRLLDADLNPVPNIDVIFRVRTGGGTVTGDSVSTDAAGVARVGSWTLGPQAGTNTLRAELRIPLAPPLTFTATGVAAQPRVWRP